MKKLLSFALVMMLSVSVTAFAAETSINQDSDDRTGGTSIIYTVAPTYTVTIPETVTLSKIEKQDGTVTYESEMGVTADAGLRLLEGQALRLSLYSNFKMKTSQDAEYELPYTLTVGAGAYAQELSDGDTIGYFHTNTTEQIIFMHIATEDPFYAGEYKGTVTFGIEVVPTFTVRLGSGEYTIENGMTWEDFAELYAGVIEFDETDGSVSMARENGSLFLDNSFVKKDDVIVKRGNYFLLA
ncbi:MAG: hypothetical protein MR274_07555 [Clostridium sp.]|nr:hypothetical protein [Clostridium sp.]